MHATFTFLGSGTSRGVPMLACDCETCRSDDPRDHRFRTSGLVTVGGRRILIDCGPELRLQLLRANVDSLDAVLLTHSHADHLNGIDDLTGITMAARRPLPFYAAPATLAIVQSRFDYIDKLRHRPDGTPRWSVPQLEFHAVTAPFKAADLAVTPLPIYHGDVLICGWRIGDLAYLCDCSRIPEETYPLLEGVTDVVIDALRWKPHPTHFSIEQAIAEVARIRPRHAWLTHLTHDILYARDQPRLPQGVSFAYDTLSFPFEVR